MMISFNPLFIGTSFVTKLGTSPQEVDHEFQSPIHRDFFCDPWKERPGKKRVLVSIPYSSGVLS